MGSILVCKKAIPKQLLKKRTGVAVEVKNDAPATAGIKRPRKLDPEEEAAFAAKKAKLAEGPNEPDFSEEKCLAFFKEYAATEEEGIVLEGMLLLCEHLGVDPGNVVMLVIAWSLGAACQGYFSKEEWMTGMAHFRCDSLTKLQASLPHLESLLDDPKSFKDIYCFAFEFMKEGDQRDVGVSDAREMMKLLLTNWPLFPHFDTFLAESMQHRAVNKDQWCSLLEFSLIISTLDDLPQYDADSAWPVMLDDFVEWCKKQPNLSTVDGDMIASADVNKASAGDTITSVGDMTSSAGDMTSSADDLTASAGDTTASACARAMITTD